MKRSFTSFLACHTDQPTKLGVSSHVTRELPYNVPFSAKLEAITNSFEQWDSMAAKCADQITLSCRNEAMSITRTLFGQFKYGELDRIALYVSWSLTDSMSGEMAYSALFPTPNSSLELSLINKSLFSQNA